MEVSTQPVHHYRLRLVVETMPRGKPVCPGFTCCLLEKPAPKNAADRAGTPLAPGKKRVQVSSEGRIERDDPVWDVETYGEFLCCANRLFTVSGDPLVDRDRDQVDTRLGSEDRREEVEENRAVFSA
ncbi:hypothetical protein DSECCO2_337270 [anaerobic digester metagenome]